MTNDVNTLNGALQELGETMASNLQAKGVTASASDGLTTLAGKILTIPSGGSCYHIEFSEDSYVAVGGTATLEIMLQENYAPKSGATVTVVGSDSSLYTGLTDSTGLATVTVTGVSSETTFTATYQGVSDTCTVTVQTGPLFYDDCSTDNTNLYDTTTNWTKSSFTFDSSNSCYAMSRTSSPSGMCTLWIKDLTVTDQVKITVDMKIGTSGSQNTQAGPLVMNSAKTKGFLAMIESWSSSTGAYSLGTINAPTGTHGTKVVNDQSLGVNAKSYWLTYEMSINSSSVELNIYNGSTKIKTGTVSSSQLDSTGNIVGFLMSYDSGAKVYLKNLKVEAL